MALLHDLELDPVEQEIHQHNGSEQQEVAGQRVDWRGHCLSQCNWSFQVSIAQTAATGLWVERSRACSLVQGPANIQLAEAENQWKCILRYLSSF